MEEFYKVYRSLFLRFYRALEKETLRHFLTTDYDWGKPSSVGFSYFVKMVEDNVVFMNFDSSDEYPGFVGIPWRDVWKRMDERWKVLFKDYFYAFETKVIPAFWSDLCNVINKEKRNLDLLELHTPLGMTRVSYQDGFILVHAEGKPIIYSVKRLPSEYDILRRIKALCMKE